MLRLQRGESPIRTVFYKCPHFLCKRNRALEPSSRALSVHPTRFLCGGTVPAALRGVRNAAAPDAGLSRGEPGSRGDSTARGTRRASGGGAGQGGLMVSDVDPREEGAGGEARAELAGQLSGPFGVLGP